jgi:two-component system, chemotaxis family, sensor kinase CheA
MNEKYKKLFLVEADEKMIDLNKALIGMEKDSANTAFANDAMRSAHTLKSSAAAMGYVEISHLAHAMEDFFEEVRSKKHILESNVLELLFKCVDALNSAVGRIKRGEDEQDTKKIVELLNKIKASNFKVKGRLKTEILKLKTEIVEPLEAIKVDVNILDRLMNLTEELLVEKMRLNELVQKSMVQNVNTSDVSEHTSISGSSPLQSKEIEHLKSTSENFNRLLGDLQYNVMQARMVPLGQIFERFPRMVRDLAKEQKKQITFEMKGQGIELDRTIIDRLGEPLIHLLRNAVDHGVESRGVITLSAMRDRDRVLIRVENDSGQINWEKVVRSALSRNIINKAAHDQYLIHISKSNNQIFNLKPEILDLIYDERLSTKEAVTETSGRGVGLSIVKSVIEALGGSVSLESSSKNIGVVFTISLPLTLAIIQALLVRSSDQIFALPFSHVDRSVRVHAKDIKKAFDQEVAVVDKEDIPLIRLDSLFALKEKEDEGIFLSEGALKSKRYKLNAELMVIIKKDNVPAAGLVIDELISEQDIVVKSFKGVLKQSKGFAGITLLGDGMPALILDVATLI